MNLRLTDQSQEEQLTEDDSRDGIWLSNNQFVYRVENKENNTVSLQVLDILTWATHILDPTL